jgi:hypothetical protein
MRRSLTHVVIASAAMSLSVPAFAQTAGNPNPKCPPGAWFCAEADVSVTPPVQVVPQQPAQPQQPVVQPQAPTVVVEEPAEPAPAPPPVRRVRIPPPPNAPPVVVYQQVPAPPPQVIIVMPGYGQGYYGYGRPVRPVPPPPTAAPKPRWQSEIGLNLRVEGMAFGKSAGTASTAGMGGVGLSLRYRPTPHFAFDLGVDVLAGNDYNGFERVEVPVSLNGLLYLNPRSRVQFYLLGGAHISRAQVKSEFPAPQLSVNREGEYSATYTYFGGQGGGGFEFRLSKRIALNLDGVGFIRKRIDEHAARMPEFIDPNNGKTTNTSAGALIRGGLTFWW